MQETNKLPSTAFSILNKRWSRKATGRKEKRRNSSKIERRKSVRLYISGRDLIELLLPLVS